MQNNNKNVLAGLDRRSFLKLGVAAGAVSTLPLPYAQARKITTNARILIVGAGAAGISLANRLNRSAEGAKITLVGARIPHLYQPGFTLIAAGLWSPKNVITQTKDWLPANVSWIAKDADAFDPANKKVRLQGGDTLEYDLLIVATGCQLNYDQIEGMSKDLIGKNGIGSVYAGPDYAEKTNQMVEQYIAKGEGQAIFTLANTPIKCAGAPLKMAFTSLDRFERSGKRSSMDVRFNTPYKNKVFSVPFYNEFVLNRWQEQGMDFKDERVLTGIDAAAQKASFTLPNGSVETQSFDFIHVVPPMSAPDSVKQSELVWQTGSSAGNWVEADKFTLQHGRFPEVFSVGDVAGVPFGKTAASVKKQVPVVEQNVLSFLEGRELTAAWDGYTSCPLITAIGKAMLAEFGFDGKFLPSFPFIDPKEESWAVWLMKEKMLKPAYYAMLDGRV
ncbi:NAD(P)/FAD-dependent oxidoreductase [Reinekea marinisedimentorum]|uniref:Sulfide:quinone oxidoreductase n=1 Tax=Reinekea marinisedimentorum TaxID=230495 RepID=A0A4R3IAF4_9GAMM|nr:FAD/NAD(P)-binding oxidoreductase [Reinekea marinisedimentorum]TCS43280.1 sulfide:quinone oxidoreductase [Reinekea marinisedimentorum]